MDKKIIYIVGFLGSIASIIGILFLFIPSNPSSAISQNQSGQNNMQAGRDVIQTTVYNKDERLTVDKIPKFEGFIYSGKNPEITDFLIKNDDRVVYINAGFDADMDKTVSIYGIDAMFPEPDDDISITYYSGCPDNIGEIKDADESVSLSNYCFEGVELYLGNDADIFYQRGFYSLKGYYTVKVFGFNQGIQSISISSVEVKDIY